MQATTFKMNTTQNQPHQSSNTQQTKNAGFRLQNEHHPKPAAPKLQHTKNWECRLKPANRTPPKTSRTKAPKHNELQMQASACKTNTTQNQPHQTYNAQKTENAGFSLQNEHHAKPAAPKFQHTTN